MKGVKIATCNRDRSRAFLVLLIFCTHLTCIYTLAR